MDLVNSVTQNSNNRNETMENGAGSGSCSSPSSGDGDGDGHNGKRYNCFLSAASVDDGSAQMQQEEINSEIAKTSTTTTTTPAPAKKAPKQVPDYLKAIGMDPRQFWPKKYRFTREKSPGQHNPLTIGQRNFYESNGYIVIDDCISSRLLMAIRNYYNLEEDQNRARELLIDEFLEEKLLIKNGKLIQYVKCFCDERLMLMTHKLIDSFQTSEQVKAVIDNEQQQQRQHLYRDWLYLPFRPIDKVVCVVSAIEPIEHVILIVPGTHRVGQCSISSTLESINSTYNTSQESSQQIMARELFECAPDKLSSLVDNSKKGFKYINLKPGQTLFYHPGLIHGFSDDLVNFKKKQLASIAYYAAADCEYIDYRKSEGLNENENKINIPITLAHFKNSNPCDYTSWIDKPKLIHDTKQSNM